VAAHSVYWNWQNIPHPLALILKYLFLLLCTSKSVGKEVQYVMLLSSQETYLFLSDGISIYGLMKYFSPDGKSLHLNIPWDNYFQSRQVLVVRENDG